MRFSILVTGLLGLVGTPVRARIDRIGIPVTIKPGDTFNATMEVPIEQPRDYAMLWGLTVYDSTTPPAMLPQRGILGNLIGSYQTSQISGAGGWQVSLPLRIDPGSRSGNAVVQMLATRAFGVNNYVLVSGWWWNVTVGDKTSEELVWAKADISWQLYNGTG